MRQSILKIFPLVSLALAGLILLPLLFLPVREALFLTQSYEIRQLEAHSEKLETLFFTAEAWSKLDFEKDGREFRFGGEMYDIHTVTETGGGVLVLALHDAKEKKLLEVFGKPAGSHGSQPLNTHNLSFVPYFNQGEFCPDLDIPLSGDAPVKTLIRHYSDPIRGIGSPPPETV